jgi:hypothetical protein
MYVKATLPGAAAAQVPDPGESAAAAGAPFPGEHAPGAQPALARLQPHPRVRGDQGLPLHSQEGIPQCPRREKQDMEAKVHSSLHSILRR